MCEGHDLWRSWWKAKEPNVVRAAWAVTTAGGSFTWSDLGKGPDDPYFSTQAFTTYPSAARAIDVLHDIMTKRVPAFYRMMPADQLLQAPVPALTFCLAEPGAQYIIYCDDGSPFLLDVSAALTALNLTWFDPATGNATAGREVAKSAHVAKLEAPKLGQHWVALLVGKS